ncbi:ABC transporter permease [Nonomuraea sp. NPDC050310]|uniref:ABC transporter permease n=1 Tax=Nonomuraea sp. NPDC050310 TaxID=3154935 RepID=UPI0033FAFF45
MRETVAVARFGARLLWRDKVALSTSVALSLGLGIFLPLMMHKLGVSGGLRVHLGLLAMIVTISAFQQTVITLTARRDQLILKRMRATGLGDGAILAGEIVNVAAQALAVMLAITATLLLAGVIEPPAQPVLVVLILALGALALAVLGAAYTLAVPRAELAAVLAMPFFLLGGVGAGGFGPLTELLPGWITQVLHWLPNVAFADLLEQAHTGAGGYLPPLARLAVFVAVAVLAIRLRFRWEPRRT